VRAAGQPLQARRPGLAIPLRLLPGGPAAGDPALVAGTDRVRRYPSPSRRRGHDLASRRPGDLRRRLRRAPADPGQRHASGRDLRCGRALAGSVLHQPGTDPARDEASRRAAARRQRYLDAVPAGYAGAVAAFNDSQLAEQDRARRAGRRQLSDITLEGRLRILRDLARHLATAGRITSWAEVTTADLEDFLASRPRSRRQDTYVLRRYFAWARQRKLLLIDPARPLRLGPQPGFTGTVLDASSQRALLRRWTNPATHPHERLAGLLALLHAASSAQIRGLTVTGIDARDRTLALAGRPFPTPADPATWAAVQACLAHRDRLATVNPHVIVTGATRTGDAPADGSYLSTRLAPAGTTPSACRQTRIAQLVNDLDPKLTAAALGMRDSGLVRYLADNVARDRLQRTMPG